MEFDGDNAIEIAVLGRNALEDPQLHCMSTIVYSFLTSPKSSERNRLSRLTLTLLGTFAG